MIVTRSGTGLNTPRRYGKDSSTTAVDSQLGRSCFWTDLFGWATTENHCSISNDSHVGNPGHVGAGKLS